MAAVASLASLADFGGVGLLGLWLGWGRNAGTRLFGVGLRRTSRRSSLLGLVAVAVGVAVLLVCVVLRCCCLP